MVNTEENWQLYSCLDSAVTYGCSNPIFEEIDEEDYVDIYQQTVDLLPVLIYMSTLGIRVDKDRLLATKIEVQSEMKTLQEELNDLCGFSINFASSQQCSQYLYGIKGVKPYTRGGSTTTDEKSLSRMAARGIREAYLIGRLRKAAKLLGTYLEVAFDPDGRLRCNWRPRGTKFARLSSSKTIFGTGLNLQNIHSRFRSFMIPDEGMFFLEQDKRQAEWIVVAYLSNDANMMKIIEMGVDPHVATGALMTGAAPDLIKLEDKFLDKSRDPDFIAKVRQEQVPELLKIVEEIISRLRFIMEVRVGGDLT